MLGIILVSVASILPLAAGHSAFYHPSMYGFNVTDSTPIDNRPVAPLRDRTFDQWWFHGHLDFPPNDGDFFELPAGKGVTAEIACDKGATSYYTTNPGGDIRDPDNPNNVCPRRGMEAYHTTGFDDLTGCGLAIAYKNNARDVNPDDFAIFTVNQTCVWTRFTDFQVPANMPPCPEGGCTCAFFWVHSQNSGGEENYMNGFKCNVTGSTSTVPLAKPKVARRCGADPANNKLQSAPGNCTYGAKQPFYWFNLERNNMFEGAFSPPVYNDLYNFIDGPQNDIFENSYSLLPDPAPNAALPVLADVSSPATTTASTPTTTNLPASTSIPAATTSPVTTSPAPTKQKSNTCKIKRTSSSAALAARSLGSEPSSRHRYSIYSMAKRSRRLRPGKRGSLWHMF